MGMFWFRLARWIFISMSWVGTLKPEVFIITGNENYNLAFAA